MKTINTKVVSSSVRAAVAAIMLAAASSGFGMNETVEFTIAEDGYYPMATITNSWWWAGNGPVQNLDMAAITMTVNNLYVGGSTIPINNGSYIGFCGEIQQPINVDTYMHSNKPMVMLDIASAGMGASSGIASGGIGVTKAKLVNILFDRHYAGRYKDNWNLKTTVAFQLALWEFIHESESTEAWTLFDDMSSLATFRNNGYDTNRNDGDWALVSEGVMLGEQYIQDVLTHNPQDYTPTLQIIGLVNEYDQDVLIPLAAIPEPRWLLAPGLAAVLFLFRRRRM
jgi:hypothetical protein